MYNHAPNNYKCPLCLAINEIENEDTMMKQADIVYKDKYVTVAINSKFVGNNPGHVIIFPTQHYENLYDLPDEIANHVIQLSKHISLAIKNLRSCDGVMILQNNEPASGQHAFHYHMHIFPRFENDNISTNMDNAKVSDPKERIPFSVSLKKYLKDNQTINQF